MSETYIIYQICSNDLPDFIYIGSTKDFAERKINHKSRCYNEKDKRYNLKIYQTIRNNGGWNNWQMKQIELYNCNDKTAALKREQYWIELKQANLNSMRSYISEEQKKEHQKEYKIKNADKIKEYKKQYRTENADKIKEYQKEYQKEYYTENADKIKEQNKQYYTDNAYKIKEYQKEYQKEYRTENSDKFKAKFNCKCGGKYVYNHKLTHLKTKKHLNYLNQITKVNELLEN